MASGSIKTNWISAAGYSTALRLDWNSSTNTGGNYSTVNWSVYAESGNASYGVKADASINVNGSSYSISRQLATNGKYMGGGSTTVYHNSDGTKSFSISMTARIYSRGDNAWASGSWNLDRIPRQANITGAPDFNDLNNPTITYSNPAGWNVSSLQACISFTGSADDIRYRDIAKDGSSYTFPLTEAERNVLRANCVDSNSRSVAFFVRTVIGGQTYYSTLWKTLSIADAAPTISPEVYDTDSAAIALTGDKNKLIRYVSNVYCKMNPQAKKYASIIGTTIENGNPNNHIYGYDGTFTDVISGNFKFTVRDSRQNSAEKTITKNIINYINLTCNLKTSTITADGKLRIDINGDYWSGNFGKVTNSLNLTYWLQENEGSWGAEKPVTGVNISGNKYSATLNFTGLDYKKTYVVCVRAKDKVQQKDSYTKKLQAFSVFEWNNKKMNINVPTYVEGQRIKTSFENEWQPITDFGPECSDLGYEPCAWCVNNGQLRLKGLIAAPTKGIVSDYLLCKIPITLKNRRYLTASSQAEELNATAAYRLEPDGRFLIHGGYLKGWVSLDGICVNL